MGYLDGDLSEYSQEMPLYAAQNNIEADAALSTTFQDSGVYMLDSSDQNQTVHHKPIQSSTKMVAAALHPATDRFSKMSSPYKDIAPSFDPWIDQTNPSRTYPDGHGTLWTPIEGYEELHSPGQTDLAPGLQQFSDDDDHRYTTQGLGRRGPSKDHLINSPRTQQQPSNIAKHLDLYGNTDPWTSLSVSHSYSSISDRKCAGTSTLKRKRNEESDDLPKKRARTTNDGHSKQRWSEFKSKFDVKKLIIKDPNGYTLPSCFSERKFKSSEAHLSAGCALPLDINPEDPGDFIRRFPNHLHGQPLLWLTEVAGGEGWGVKKIYDHLPDSVKQNDLHDHNGRAEKRSAIKARRALASHQPWGRYTKSMIEARKWLMKEHDAGDDEFTLSGCSNRQIHSYDIDEIFGICRNGRHHFKNLTDDEKFDIIHSLQGLAQASPRASFIATDTAKEQVEAECRKGFHLLHLVEHFRGGFDGVHSASQRQREVEFSWAAKFYGWMMSMGKAGLEAHMAQIQSGTVELEPNRLLTMQQTLLRSILQGSGAAGPELQSDQQHDDGGFRECYDVSAEQAFILSTWRSDWAMELCQLLKDLLKPSRSGDDFKEGFGAGKNGREEVATDFEKLENGIEEADAE